MSSQPNANLADIQRKRAIAITEIRNKTAKFLGWSENDIQEQLIDEALDRATEEIQYEYEEYGDKSLLGIEKGDEIDLTNFTSWEYLDHQLVESGLVFKTK